MCLYAGAFYSFTSSNIDCFIQSLHLFWICRSGLWHFRVIRTPLDQCSWLQYMQGHCVPCPDCGSSQVFGALRLYKHAWINVCGCAACRLTLVTVWVPRLGRRCPHHVLKFISLDDFTLRSWNTCGTFEVCLCMYFKCLILIFEETIT